MKIVRSFLLLTGTLVISINAADIQLRHRNRRAVAVVNSDLDGEGDDGSFIRNSHPTVDETRFWQRFMAEDSSVPPPPPPAPFLLADVVAGESDLTVFQSFALITPSFAQNLLGASIPTTILAPTDDAFANFEDQDLLTRLMQPEWTAQRQLFLFGHAVRPEAFPAMFSSNITDGLSVGTFVQQNPVIFNVRDDGIFVARSGFGTAHQVLEADLIADNGVLHKIGGVLNQVTFYVDIIDLAATLPVFSTMTALLMQTGLDALLRSGLYTVLAPINQGFEALPAEILEFLTDPANEDSLRKVLLYHIVPGLYPSVLLSSGQELVTVEGSTVQFSLVPQAEGPPQGFFNSVPVVSVDLGGKQAVAHSIFGVLVPPGITLP